MLTLLVYLFFLQAASWLLPALLASISVPTEIIKWTLGCQRQYTFFSSILLPSYLNLALLLRLVATSTLKLFPLGFCDRLSPALLFLSPLCILSVGSSFPVPWLVFCHFSPLLILHAPFGPTSMISSISCILMLPKSPTQTCSHSADTSANCCWASPQGVCSQGTILMGLVWLVPP